MAHRMVVAAVLSLILAVLLVAAGCGSGGSSSSKPSRSFNAADDARYSESAVAHLAGFKSDGIAYTGPGGCQIAAILRTRSSVKLYSDAGDPVVTNRRGDVGVKFFPEPGCRERLLRALNKVP